MPISFNHRVDALFVFHLENLITQPLAFSNNIGNPAGLAQNDMECILQKAAAKQINLPWVRLRRLCSQKMMSSQQSGWWESVARILLGVLWWAALFPFHACELRLDYLPKMVLLSAPSGVSYLCFGDGLYCPTTNFINKYFLCRTPNIIVFRFWQTAARCRWKALRICIGFILCVLFFVHKNTIRPKNNYDVLL